MHVVVILRLSFIDVVGSGMFVGGQRGGPKRPSWVSGREPLQKKYGSNRRAAARKLTRKESQPSSSRPRSSALASLSASDASSARHKRRERASTGLPAIVSRREASLSPPRLSICDTSLSPPASRAPERTASKSPRRRSRSPSLEVVDLVEHTTPAKSSPPRATARPSVPSGHEIEPFLYPARDLEPGASGGPLLCSNGQINYI